MISMISIVSVSDTKFSNAFHLAQSSTIRLVSEGRLDINSNRWLETKYTLSFSLLMSALWSSQTLFNVFFCLRLLILTFS